MLLLLPSSGLPAVTMVMDTRLPLSGSGVVSAELSRVRVEESVCTHSPQQVNLLALGFKADPPIETSHADANPHTYAERYDGKHHHVNGYYLLPWAAKIQHTMQGFL